MGSAQQTRKPYMYKYTMCEFICIIYLLDVIDEPRIVKEVMGMEYNESWILAMHEDMDTLINNDTQDPLLLSNGGTPIGSKWVFKKKISLNGSV